MRHIKSERARNAVWHMSRKDGKTLCGKVLEKFRVKRKAPLNDAERCLRCMESDG